MLSHLLFSPLITNSTPRLQQFPRQLSVSSSCLHCDFCKDVSHLKFWLGERPTDGSPVRPATGPRKPLEKKRRKENEADYRAISPPSAIKSQYVAEPRRTSACQAHTYVCTHAYIHARGSKLQRVQKEKGKKRRRQEHCSRLAVGKVRPPGGLVQRLSGTPSRASNQINDQDQVSSLPAN